MAFLNIPKGKSEFEKIRREGLYYVDKTGLIGDFIYLYAQAFVEYAKSVDIDETVARDLFAKSLIGSAKMITDSGKSLDELIEMVSSKGGTTIAGLEKLREGGLPKAVEDCCKACTKRAYELSK